MSHEHVTKLRMSYKQPPLITVRLEVQILLEVFAANSLTNETFFTSSIKVAAHCLTTAMLPWLRGELCAEVGDGVKG